MSSNWSDEEADELFPATEIEDDPDKSLADVHPLGEDAPFEENHQDDTDPEWKLSEEEAELDDDGDDEEKDTPVSKVLKNSPFILLINGRLLFTHSWLFIQSVYLQKQPN